MWWRNDTGYSVTSLNLKSSHQLSPVFFPIKWWLHWVNYCIKRTNWWFLSSSHGSYDYEQGFFYVELTLVHKGCCWAWAIFHIVDAGWRISLWWGLGHTALGIWGIFSWRSLRKRQKQAIKPSCERFPPCTQRKGSSLSPKTKGCQGESWQTQLAVSPSLLGLPHLLNLYFYRTVPSSSSRA